MSEYIIDFDGVQTEEDVQDRVVESLPLPDYYGRNLDALYDVLTEQGEGMDITVVGCDSADPDVQPYIDDLIEVMEDVSTQVDNFIVRVEGDFDN